jgi:septum site-determining protein MinC
MDNVIFKGTKDGVTVYLKNESYENIKKEIIDKIEQGKDFFAGCKLSIVDEFGKLPNVDLYELENALKETYNITTTISHIKSEIEKPEKVFSGIYEGRTKFIKNTVRSGQGISYNGNIVILGDVNSGAEVYASGNIIVLGVLRGIANAGNNGNRRAIVAAYTLQPSLLRIADVIARSPDDNSCKPSMPEIARVKDDIIVVEPYLPNKYI